MSFGWRSLETLKEEQPADEEDDDAEEEVLVKHEAVVNYLKARVREPPASVQSIFEGMRLGDTRSAVDLRRERRVDEMLGSNPFVKVDLDDEGERLYSYVPAHADVVDRTSLLKMVADRDDGVPYTELFECYPGVEEDIEDAIVSGDVIAVFDSVNHSTSLFPRREKYLVQLQATVSADQNEAEISVVGTSVSCVDDVRRGDAVLIGEEWCRVGSRVHRKGSQPRRAQRPPSVTSTSEMHSQNVYCDVFDEDQMPIHPPLDEPVSAEPLYRHGVSNDVRALWLKTGKDVPPDHADLRLKLEELATGKQTKATASNTKRPRETRWQGAAAAKLKAEKQKASTKRRRLLQNPRLLRLTNTHLKGTEIGDALMRADARTAHLFPSDGGDDKGN